MVVVGGGCGGGNKMRGIAWHCCAEVASSPTKLTHGDVQPVKQLPELGGPTPPPTYPSLTRIV